MAGGRAGTSSCFSASVLDGVCDFQFGSHSPAGNTTSCHTRTTVLSLYRARLHLCTVLEHHCFCGTRWMWQIFCFHCLTVLNLMYPSVLDSITRGWTMSSWRATTLPWLGCAWKMMTPTSASPTRTKASWRTGKVVLMSSGWVLTVATSFPSPTWTLYLTMNMERGTDTGRWTKSIQTFIALFILYILLQIALTV